MVRLGIFLLGLGALMSSGCCAVQRMQCSRCDDSPCLMACNDVGCAPCVSTPVDSQLGPASPMPMEEPAAEELPGDAPPPPAEATTPAEETTEPVDVTPNNEIDAPLPPVVRENKTVVPASAYEIAIRSQQQNRPARKPILIPIGHKISSFVE